MLELSLRSCRKIITISDHNQKLLSEKYPHLADKIEVIRLSADIGQDPIELRNRKNLLIVGGFQDRKGYDILLEAINKIDRDDVHLWIVGYEGPVDVEGLVKRLSLEEKVTIFGAVSDDILKVLYLYCDIFCMPSRMDKDGVGEGLPVSLMEAMSYKKPVVATYHTGIPELVPDILVEENDVDGLADGIVKLVDDPDLRIQMGDRNREIIRNDYSNKNVKKLLDTFR
jgi:glycosyltransferase involved in cell wall biosynthesis